MLTLISKQYRGGLASHQNNCYDEFRIVNSCRMTKTICRYVLFVQCLCFFGLGNRPRGLHEAMSFVGRSD